LSKPLKPPNITECLYQHSGDGRVTERSSMKKQTEDTTGTSLLWKNPSMTHLMRKYPNMLYTLEYPQRSNNQIWLGKSSTYKSDIQDTLLLQTLEADLTSKEKVSRPFWTESSTEISKRLWLPTQIGSLDSGSTSSNGSFKSWGQSLHIWEHLPPLNKTSSCQTSWKLSPSLQPDIMEDANMVTKKIRFFPNMKQKLLFRKCFGAHRFFYNKAVAEINTRYSKRVYEFSTLEHCVHCENPKSNDSWCCDKHQNKQLPWKLNVTLPSLRDAIMTPDKEIKDNKDLWQIEVPYDTRQLAIKDAVNAYSSSVALKKAGYINKFELGFKRRGQNREIFWVNKNAMKKGWDIFVSRLGGHSKLRFKEKDAMKLPKCMPKSDFKILNDSGAYYILLTVPYEKSEPTPKKYSVLSMDPGVRCFQTGYSPDGHILKGGTRQRELVRKYYEKIDHLKSVRSKSMKRTTKHNITKRYRKIEKRIRDIIFDMHNHISSKLAEDYEHILLPEFGTSKMLRKGVLCSSVKRMMGTFSFYNFKEKLRWACHKKGSRFYEVTEEYTSKTCTGCGSIKDNLGGNRVYNCNNCGLSIDRDVNGSRNILLKHLILS
jgi:putative transposase